MTRDDIIKLAREAATEDGSVKRTDGKNIVVYAAKTTLFLERFAALVEAAAIDKAHKSFCAELRQLHDAYALSSHPGVLRDKGAWVIPEIHPVMEYRLTRRFRHVGETK